MQLSTCQSNKNRKRQIEEHYLDSLLTTDAIIALIQAPETNYELKKKGYIDALAQRIADKKYLFLPDNHFQTLSMEETIALIPQLKEHWGMDALAIEVPYSKQQYFDELNAANDPEIIAYVLDHIEEMFAINLLSDATMARKMIETCKRFGIAVYAINIPEKSELGITDYGLIYDVVTMHYELPFDKKAFVEKMEPLENLPLEKKADDPDFHWIQNLFMGAAIKQMTAKKIAIWVGSAHAAPMISFRQKGKEKVFSKSTRRLLGLDQSDCLYFMGNKPKGHYIMANVLEGFCLATGQYQRRDNLQSNFNHSLKEFGKNPFEQLEYNHRQLHEKVEKLNRVVGVMKD